MKNVNDFIKGEIKSRDSDNYTLREFKRTYRLPAHAETEKLASYRAPNGKLIIEIPLGTVQHENKSPAIQHDPRLAASTLDDVDHRIIEDILPRVSDDGKQILMSFQLPTGGDKVIDASNIKVTLKDRDVIVVIEDDNTNADDLSQFFFYKRITMPDNADLATLKCTLENNRLVMKAPVIERIGTATKGSVKMGPRIKEDSKSLT
jgi:HSP20 family molecular chaperone IbpA